MSHIPAIPASAPSDMVLQREFSAPPEHLWRFFTEPELLARWFGPADVHIDPATVVLSPEPGGHMDLDMVDNETGEHYPIRSQFTHLDPPSYLEGTASGETGLDRDVEDVTLRVWLTPAGRGTTLTVVEGPFDPVLRDMTADGWRSSFAKVDAILAGQWPGTSGS